jgi:hypothetical protein
MDPAGQIPAEVVPAHLSALRRHFEISLYFLVLTGVLTLVCTGKLDLVTILLLPAAMLFKGYRWWHGRARKFPTAWQPGSPSPICFLSVRSLDRFAHAGESDAQNPGLYAALLATIHLMLFAIIVRLYQRDDHAGLPVSDHDGLRFHAGFGHPDRGHGLPVFFPRVSRLAVSTFVGPGNVAQRAGRGHAAHGVRHRRRPAPAQRARPDFRRHRPRFAGVGAVIFFLLPRFSGGYMSGFNLQPTLISGFSDDVELGEIGEIKKSSMVVMRITVDGGLQAAHGVRWRGVALTKFDGKRWYNEPHEPVRRSPHPARAAGFASIPKTPSREGRAFRSITPCCSSPLAAPRFSLPMMWKPCAGDSTARPADPLRPAAHLSI